VCVALPFLHNFPYKRVFQDFVGSGCGSCRAVGFGNGGVELPGSATAVCSYFTIIRLVLRRHCQFSLFVHRLTCKLVLTS
jgi:hypothetical protein